MAKWIFTRPGSWDYPMLGFRATTGDVCEADQAPDAWWDATDSGATVTVPVVPIAGIDEDLDGAVLVYNASTNKDERKLPAAAGLLTEASADARIDTRARSYISPTGIAFIGDSISTFNSSSAEAWHFVMCATSNGRLLHRGRFGTAGYTLAQIRATHLPQALALSPLPGAVAICGGTNDVGSGTYNEATSRAVLLDIIAQLKDAGIRPVLWTLPPRDDDANVNIRVQRWNAWIHVYGNANGYPVIDSHAILVNPDTGLYQDALQQDDVHPGTYGHWVLGSTVGTDEAFLSHFPDTRPYLSDSRGADPNLIPANARLFDAGVNGNGSPNNWTGVSIGTACTGAQVADTAIPGNWYRFTKTTAHTGQALIRQEIVAGASTFAVGDRVALAVPFRIDADPTGAVVAAVSLIYRTDSATISTTIAATIKGNNGSGIAYAEGTVPATCTRIRVEISINGQPASVTETFDVSRPTIINLTALGLA